MKRGPLKSFRRSVHGCAERIENYALFGMEDDKQPQDVEVQSSDVAVTIQSSQGEKKSK